MEIIWSEYSLLRIEKIGQFIALDSPDAAKIFVDKLILSVEHLKKFPYLGKLTPENAAFRQIVFERYRIIYRLAEQSIEIVTIYPLV